MLCWSNVDFLTIQGLDLTILKLTVKNCDREFPLIPIVLEGFLIKCRAEIRVMWMAKRQENTFDSMIKHRQSQWTLEGFYEGATVGVIQLEAFDQQNMLKT